MKARIPGKRGLSKGTKMAVEDYIDTYEKAVTRRLLKLCCVALNKDFGFGKDWRKGRSKAMSTTKETRPIDANNLARRIREYMDDFPNATTRLATCRAILSMLGDETQTPTLRPITREQVEKVWRGEWIDCSNGWMCSRCEHDNTYAKPFCPNCGAPMTDKAVDMVMERLEALYGQENT